MDEDRFRRWLNLTPQQFDLVKAVYRLRNRGLKPSPKSIQAEYYAAHGKNIIKPNLFNLLRELQSRKVLVKVAQAEYALDLDGISAALDSSKMRLSADMEELARTRSQVDQFFKEMTYQREHPEVKILDGPRIWQALAQMLSTSSEFSITEDFPTLACTPEISAAGGREPYWEALRRAQKEKKARVNITTPLDVDSLFMLAFRAYEDPRTAYRETKGTLERLQTIAERSKNIDIRFTESPSGLGLAVASVKEPGEFAIFTRDEHDQVTGAIQIRSHKTAASAERTLAAHHQAAIPIKSPAGQAKMRRIKQQIKDKFGSIGR